MSLISGDGNAPAFATSSIDTRIYGNPDDIRDAAAKVYELYETLNDALNEMRQSLIPVNTYWEGETAKAYSNALYSFRNCTSEHSSFAYRVYEAMRSYAQQLDYHYRDMETIRTNARRCNLTIANDYDIMAPEPAGSPPVPPPATASTHEQDLYRVMLAEHQAQVQKAIDFDDLSHETQKVRDNLDDWVRRHLLSVQSNPPKSFGAYAIDSINEYQEEPWTLIPDGVSAAFSARSDLRQDKLKEHAAILTRNMEIPAQRQVRPLLGRRFQHVLQEAHDSRSAASLASKVSTGATIASGLLLAYDVKGSDTPTKDAVSDSAGMVGGIFIGSRVGAYAAQLSGRAVLGTAVGGPVGIVASIAISTAADFAYDQLPLEYQERVDNFWWHLPYYVGFDW
ncbi:hypothetical protein [Actinomyces sp.]